jgi:Chloroplast import apparatus Tic20-like
MVWRGSSSPRDRIFACLVYALPLVEVVVFGSYIFAQIPILQTVYFTILFPFIFVYGLLGSFIGSFAGFIIFLLLYFLVVRNEQLRHFLRFNTMQALLISIFATLCQLVLQLLGIFDPNSESLLMMVGFNLIFLSVVVASVFSIVQCVRGLYAEIPVISEAAYAQVR